MTENNDSKMNTNFKETVKNLLKKILIIAVIVLVLTIPFVIYFIMSINSAVKNFGDRLDQRYLVSESELISLVGRECDNATLLESVFTKDPGPKRICTFRDEDHDIVFTAVSTPRVNELTLIPFLMPDWKCDYDELYYDWIEERIDSELKNEGIELVQGFPKNLNEVKVRSFSVRDYYLITTHEDESTDKEFIMDSLNSYILPAFLKNKDMKVGFIGEFVNPADYYETNNSDNSYDSYKELDYSEETLNKTPSAAGTAIILDADVDKKGLSDYIIEVFGICAMYLPKDSDIENGRPLSSKNYEDIKDFLLHIRCSKGTSGSRVNPDTKETESIYITYSYTDWYYILNEVYGEEYPEYVKSMLEDGFNGEYSVYYNPLDDNIYEEHSSDINPFELFTAVNKVEKSDDLYTITYDIYSINSYEDGPLDTVTVIIQETEDNTYGYKLVEIN